MNTCYGVRLNRSMMVDGRKVPVSNYYVGQGPRTCSKPHQAALMSEELAKLLVTKLNNTGHHQAEVCELLCDENSTIHDNLVSLGEEAPPPAPPPSSLVNLAKAIERCFREGGLSPLEVLNHCNRVVLLG